MFALWVLTLWIGTALPPNELRVLFLLTHLGMLVIGLGAAVMIEYSGFLWVLGRGSLGEVRKTAKRLSLLSWVGSSGMLLSGMFLSPNIANPLTVIKLLAVLIVGLNAANSRSLLRRLDPLHKKLDFRDAQSNLQVWCVTGGAVSQIAWWTAVLVGVINTASRGS